MASRFSGLKGEAIVNLVNCEVKVVMSKALRNRLLLVAFANPVLPRWGLAANLPLAGQLQFLRMQRLRSPSFQKLPAFFCTIPAPQLKSLFKSSQNPKLFNLTPVFHGGYRLLPSLQAERGTWHANLGVRKPIQSLYGLGGWLGFETNSQRLEDGGSWNGGLELQISRLLIGSNLALNPYNFNRFELGGLILVPRKRYLFFDKFGLSFIHRKFSEIQTPKMEAPRTLIKAVCFSLKTKKFLGLFLDLNIQILDLLKHGSSLSLKFQASLNGVFQAFAPEKESLFSLCDPRFEPELHACNLVEKLTPSQQLINACEMGHLHELAHQLETGAINPPAGVDVDQFLSKSTTDLKMLQQLAQKAVQEGLVDLDSLQIVIPNSSREDFLQFLSSLESLAHNSNAKAKLSQSQLDDFFKTTWETLVPYFGPKLDEFVKGNGPASFSKLLAKPLFYVIKQTNNSPKFLRDWLTSPQVLPPQLENFTEKLLELCEGFWARHGSGINDQDGEETLAVQIQALLDSPPYEKNVIIDHFNYQTKVWLHEEHGGNQRSEIIFENLRGLSKNYLLDLLLNCSGREPLFSKVETESDLTSAEKREKLCQGIDRICNVIKNPYDFLNKKLIWTVATKEAQKALKSTQIALKKVGDRSKLLLENCNTAFTKIDADQVKSLSKTGVKILIQGVRSLKNRAGLAVDAIKKRFVDPPRLSERQELRLKNLQYQVPFQKALAYNTKRKPSASSASTDDPATDRTRPETPISDLDQESENSVTDFLENQDLMLCENHSPLGESDEEQTSPTSLPILAWKATAPRWALYGLTAVGLTTVAYRFLLLG